MDLYLQFGYGMMDHCRHFIRQWRQGTVILSPRDLNPNQIIRFSNEISAINGRTLIDPQFYNPRSDHHRLVMHEYWPSNFSTSMLSDRPSLSALLSELKLLNDSALTSFYIIPGIYCERVDDDWISIQETIIEESDDVLSGKEKYATICLSSEAIRFEDQIETIINCSETWAVDGFYVVPEHPNIQYLAEDPVWLSNLMILCAGLKLLGKPVIVGYSNHQLLCLAATNIDAIASGIWLNVRSFTTDKFNEPPEDDTSRRAKWYYCPQALSEYKMPFLDMGFNANAMDLLRPDDSLGSYYANVLFSGAQPSLTAYSEQQSHRHYIQCLRSQCIKSRRKSFSQTLDAQVVLLETAQRLITILHRLGVRGQDRDFSNIVDVNLSALDSLKNNRGFVLDRFW